MLFFMILDFFQVDYVFMWFEKLKKLIKLLEYNVMKYKVFFFKDLYIDFLSKLLESVVKKEIFGMNFFLEIFY